MNELARIRRAYDAIEGPSEEAVAAARELLLQHLESTESQGPSLRKRRVVVVAIAAAVLVGGLLISPAFGIGSRLLDLIQDKPPLRETRGAAWSPDGRKVVYVSRRARNSWDLSVINADGSGQRGLAGSASPFTPAWSPNGRRVAFQGLRGTGADVRGATYASVYVINVDGSGQQRLAPKGFHPAWSPDGRTIVFAARSGISIVNADGSGRRRLTQHGEQPIWSPDGRKIAFLSAALTYCDFCFHVYVVNADGSGERRLTHNATPTPTKPGPARGNFAPAWSPDGRRIAFVRATHPGRRDVGAVWVMNADGSAQRKLTRGAWGWPNDTLDAALAWSPDGRRLAFTSVRDGNAEVYTVNSDGSGLRRLTDTPEFDGDAAWSPDGRSLVFISNRDGRSAVYVMNADGSGQRRLTPRGP